MKKTLITLITITTLLSCNNNNVEYKYSERKNIVSCKNVDKDLVKEVTYTFEKFLMEHYDFDKMGEVRPALRNYLNNAEAGLFPMVERFDEDIIAFAKHLQTKEDLWQKKGEDMFLNYNNPITTCLSENFKDEQFAAIFNALASSNTLRRGNMASAIRTKLNDLSNDKAVLAYIAFDMFYAKVMLLDLNQSKEDIIKQVIAYNKAHVGHQH